VVRLVNTENDGFIVGDISGVCEPLVFWVTELDWELDALTEEDTESEFEMLGEIVADWPNELLTECDAVSESDSDIDVVSDTVNTDDTLSVDDGVTDIEIDVVSDNEDLTDGDDETLPDTLTLCVSISVCELVDRSDADLDGNCVTELHNVDVTDTDCEWLTLDVEDSVGDVVTVCEPLAESE